MGFLDRIFGSPRPQPQATTVIKNVLGEVLLEAPVRSLAGTTCLRAKDLSHADLRGQSFWGADLEGTILLGADLRGCNFTYCSLKNATLAYALVDGADFRKADLDGTDLLYTCIKCAQLADAIITPTSMIPGIKVLAA